MRILVLLSFLLPLAVQAEVLQSPSRQDTFLLSLGRCQRIDANAADYNRVGVGWGNRTDAMRDIACHAEEGGVFGDEAIRPIGSVVELARDTAAMGSPGGPALATLRRGTKVLVLSYYPADEAAAADGYVVVQKLGAEAALTRPQLSDAAYIRVGSCEARFLQRRFTPGNADAYNVNQPIESVLGEAQGLSCYTGFGTPNLPPVGSLVTLANEVSAIFCKENAGCGPGEVAKGTKLRVLSYGPFDGYSEAAVSATVVPVP